MYKTFKEFCENINFVCESTSEVQVTSKNNFLYPHTTSVVGGVSVKKEDIIGVVKVQNNYWWILRPIPELLKVFSRKVFQVYSEKTKAVTVMKIDIKSQRVYFIKNQDENDDSFKSIKFDSGTKYDFIGVIGREDNGSLSSTEFIRYQ